MTLKELKGKNPHAYALAKFNQKKQGRADKDDVDLGDGLDAFNWKQSPEGEDFWMSINTGRINDLNAGLIDASSFVLATPSYYDNSKGSLYKIAEERGWNSYTFDVVKRLDRGGKKDPLKQEIEKSIGVLQLWLKEL